METQITYGSHQIKDLKIISFSLGEQFIKKLFFFFEILSGENNDIIWYSRVWEQKTNKLCQNAITCFSGSGRKQFIEEVHSLLEKNPHAPYEGIYRNYVDL